MTTEKNARSISDDLLIFVVRMDFDGFGLKLCVCVSILCDFLRILFCVVTTVSVLLQPCRHLPACSLYIRGFCVRHKEDLPSSRREEYLLGDGVIRATSSILLLSR